MFGLTGPPPRVFTCLPYLCPKLWQGCTFIKVASFRSDGLLRCGRICGPTCVVSVCHPVFLPIGVNMFELAASQLRGEVIIYIHESTGETIPRPDESDQQQMPFASSRGEKNAGKCSAKRSTNQCTKQGQGHRVVFGQVYLSHPSIRPSIHLFLMFLIAMLHAQASVGPDRILLVCRSLQDRQDHFCLESAGSAANKVHSPRWRFSRSYAQSGQGRIAAESTVRPACVCGKES